MNDGKRIVASKPLGVTRKRKTADRNLTTAKVPLYPTTSHPEPGIIEDTLPGLNDCGCGQGITTSTPVEVTNRPGLAAIKYRVGTYALFKESMLARLSAFDRPALCGPKTLGNEVFSPSGALQYLKTRTDDDFAIVLLDAWAIVADVLTFYSERIANESYMRTAQEQLSLLYLARRISYELRSGVAANAYLAFTIEDAPGTPGRATIDAGTKVQSLPNPGEQPQIFETIETIDDAYAEWNAMKPRLRQQDKVQQFLAQQNSTSGNMDSGKGTPSPAKGPTGTVKDASAPAVGTDNTSKPKDTLFLAGVTTGLKPGDGLLIVSKIDDSNKFRLIATVTPQPAQKWTKVELQDLPRSHAQDFGMKDLAVKQPPDQTQPTAFAMLPQTILGIIPHQILSILPQSILDLLSQPAPSPSVPTPPLVPASIPAAQTLQKVLVTLPPVTLALLPPHLTTSPELLSVTTGVSDATKLVLQKGLANGVASSNSSTGGTSLLKVVSNGASSNGAHPIGVAPEIVVSADELHAIALVKNFSAQNVIDNTEANSPPPPSVFAFRTRASIFGHNAPRFEALSTSQRVGDTIMAPQPPIPNQTTPVKVTSGDLQFFKGPYLDQTWIDDLQLKSYQPKPNDDPKLAPEKAYLYLDNAYPSIVKDSWIILRDSDAPDPHEVSPHKVNEITELSKSDFMLTAKISRLTVDKSDLSSFSIRKTTVFAQSEELPLAPIPLVDPTGQPTADPTKGTPVVDPKTGEPLGDSISGQQIDIFGWINHLYKGQQVIVCGELQDNSGNSLCELTTIAKVDYVYLLVNAERFTRITLNAPLNHTYVNKTVTINANIARATHGDTTLSEVLGDGNASRVYQRFTLRNAPLTYITAPTASGVKSTLKVYVNNVEWREVQTLYGHGHRDRIFVTRTDDNGKTIVQFGDGRTGARLPTGHENVRATYRKGSGPQGAVKAGQLSLLMTRPLGVKGVTNPMDTAGSDAGEVGNDARRNATLFVQTLDRLVSLQDYEHFVQAYVGIAKAQASRLWIDSVSAVFITVAGPNAEDVKEDGPLLNGLILVMQSMSAFRTSIAIKSFRRALFRLAAKVKVDPIYSQGGVLKAVLQALQSHFSFDARSLGQPVGLSEITATIQDVPGVVATEVYRLYHYHPEHTASTTPPPDASSLQHFPPPPQQLDTGLPGIGADGTLLAAEMLVLDIAHLESWE